MAQRRSGAKKAIVATEAVDALFGMSGRSSFAITFATNYAITFAKASVIKESFVGQRKLRRTEGEKKRLRD
jgi:hypothetical protein